MSVVRRASAVVRCHQFDVNGISSETARPMVLIFSMKHCLVNIYQVCSNGAPGAHNGSAAEDLGFENKICFKIFFSRTARHRSIKFDM